MSEDNVFPIELWPVIMNFTDNDTLFNLQLVCSKLFSFVINNLERSPNRFTLAINEDKIYPFNLLGHMKVLPCNQSHMILTVMHDRLEIFQSLLANKCLTNNDILLKYLKMYKPLRIATAYYPEFIPTPPQSPRSHKRGVLIGHIPENIIPRDEYNEYTACRIILNQGGSRFCLIHQHYCNLCSKERCCYHGQKRSEVINS